MGLLLRLWEMGWCLQNLLHCAWHQVIIQLRYLSTVDAKAGQGLLAEDSQGAKEGSSGA